MSTYVQDQRIVLIFWIGLYENAIELPLKGPLGGEISTVCTIAHET